ncbi:MAG: radical SAM protein [bacterium]
MIRKRFALRNEHFGATLYDRKTLTHKFLLEDELKQEINFMGEKISNPEIWKVDLTGSPKGLIYSPLRIYFEMTLKCNLRCKTCFNSSGVEGPNEMTIEEIFKSLEGLRKDNIFDVRFTGGEVTQRKDWFEVLKYAKKLGFAVSLNTNGVYQNGSTNTLDKLIELELDQITISLDGAEEAHTLIRGPNTFRKAVDSLRYLSQNGANTRINTVLTKNSLSDFKPILNIAGQYCQEVNFFYMRTTGRALEILDSVVTSEDLHELDILIEKEKPKYPNLNILHGSQVMQNNSILNHRFGLDIGGPDGFTRMNLQSDGSVFAGGYAPYLDPSLNLGNIKNDNYSMLNIWRYSKKLNSFRKTSLKLQQICGSCEDRVAQICPGASMEMELFRRANPENGNPYCSKPLRMKDLWT